MIRSQHDANLFTVTRKLPDTGNVIVCTTLEILCEHESCLCKGASRRVADPAHVRGKPHDVALRLISVTKLIHDSLHVAEQLMGSES